MSTITTKDGTTIFYKDWGAGPPVVFSHGWPLSADAWEGPMVALAARGFRCIAHDRRGHGRSDQPSGGNDMDTYADDLAALLEALDLRDVTLVGHSTGGGEVTRYVGRHGSGRVARMVLVSAVPPILRKGPSNPDGVPDEVFEEMRGKIVADRSRFYRDLAVPFFGADRPGAQVSPGFFDAFWLQAMQGGLKAHLECIDAFSETDFTEDLKKIDVPVLFVHAGADAIVPLEASSVRAVKLVRHGALKVYDGAPHGMASTHAERLCEDIRAFVEAEQRPRAASAEAAAP